MLSVRAFLFFDTIRRTSARPLRRFVAASLPSDVTSSSESHGGGSDRMWSGHRRHSCYKYLNGIFDAMQRDLRPFLYREDRFAQRQTIIETHLDLLSEALYQFRAILDIPSLAVSCHRMGQLIPLIRSQHPELWLLPRLTSMLPLLLTEISEKTHQAQTRELIQFFWGMSRLGPSILWRPSASWIYHVQALLIDANEFGGNNACNMVEALSNFGLPLAADDQKILLQNAVHDFRDPSTSPFNLLYFLEATARQCYPMRHEIVAAAVHNCTVHFDLMNMHHIASFISSLALLQYRDLRDVLHLLRERMSFGTQSSQEMWNDDFVVLADALTQLQVETIEIEPILTNLYTLAQERHPPLDAQQIKAFTKSYEFVNFIFDTPIVTPLHL